MKIRNTLIFFLALFMGMGINMGLIFVGSWLFPLPEGLDTTTREGLKHALPLLQPTHFIFPFLAHALGTLAGAFFVTAWSTARQRRNSLLIGGLFFFGGLTTIIGMPSPLWFTLLDLAVAYFPMAWFGNTLAIKLRQ
jgi:hypothetical protein